MRRNATIWCVVEARAGQRVARAEVQATLNDALPAPRLTVSWTSDPDLARGDVKLLLLMVLCLLSGAVVIACSLLAQAMNARLDPRLRPAEREVTSK